ncbi:MAG: sugar ABC transporter permease [Clostridiales bacterium]|jgi:putative aldouronate transport system permease protein|nr:sugar ABC transporter permease [Clostridiales bacterium]
MRNGITKNKKLLIDIWKMREVYILILLPVIWYIIFSYIPIYGLSLAFKTYKANLGIFGSPWVGIENYKYVFRDPAFLESIWKTIVINLGRIAFQFPFPIILALMLNEIRLTRCKKVVQTIYTFPHFLSWVIVASIMINILNTKGMVNAILSMMGRESINFLGSVDLFKPLLYVTENWKSGGWTMIIYLAAISGINTEQYESAIIDGASRLQMMWYITLPGIKSTIEVLLILQIGNIMTQGFDQIFNLSNPATAKVGEILDMYIYRVTFLAAADFSYSTAVSLFRSVINFVFLNIADRVSKLLGSQGLFA